MYGSAEMAERLALSAMAAVDGSLTRRSAMDYANAIGSLRRA